MLLICLKISDGLYLEITYNPGKLKHQDLIKEKSKDFNSVQDSVSKSFTENFPEILQGCFIFSAVLWESWKLETLESHFALFVKSSYFVCKWLVQVGSKTPEGTNST